MTGKEQCLNWFQNEMRYDLIPESIIAVKLKMIGWLYDQQQAKTLPEISYEAFTKDGTCNYRQMAMCVVDWKKPSCNYIYRTEHLADVVELQILISRQEMAKENHATRIAILLEQIQEIDPAFEPMSWWNG